MDIHGPPPGVGGLNGLSPEQTAIYKEAGIRNDFITNLGDSIGPYMMGYVINLIMLGILMSRVWYWAVWTRKERTFIRVVVYWVSFFSLANSILLFIWFYQLFIVNYGTLPQFVNNDWYSWLPVLDECAIIACQAFNLERAYRLNGRSKWVLIGIIPFILGDITCVVARQAVVYTHPDANVPVLIRPYTYTHFYSMIIVDTSLTIAIAVGLRKSKTGWNHTDVLIKRIIVYTVETQLFPTLAAIVMSIQYSADNYTQMAFLYITCQGKIPAVMLMAVLNYRFTLQRGKATNFMSTDALIHHPEQDYKNDITSQTQDFPMMTYTPSVNERPFAHVGQ